MSLDTIIHASLDTQSRMAKEDRPVAALILMGGGARTAYQVGVLRALAAMLRLQPGTPTRFPFEVLVGTSAGALNSAFLAGEASGGLQAFDLLSNFWTDLRSQHVYEINVSPWARASRFFAALSLSRHARSHGAILDNMPLVDTLHQAVSLPGIEYAHAANARVDAVISQIGQRRHDRGNGLSARRTRPAYINHTVAGVISRQM